MEIVSLQTKQSEDSLDREFFELIQRKILVGVTLKLVHYFIVCGKQPIGNWGDDLFKIQLFENELLMETLV